MIRRIVILVVLGLGLLVSSFATGCGLDVNLPGNDDDRVTLPGGLAPPPDDQDNNEEEEEEVEVEVEE